MRAANLFSIVREDVMTTEYQSNMEHAFSPSDLRSRFNMM